MHRALSSVGMSIKLVHPLPQISRRDLFPIRAGPTPELLVGSAVVNRDIGAAVDQLLEVGSGNPRCPGFVLDHLSEGLAGNMYTAIEAVAGSLPSGDTALQYRDVQVAKRAYARGDP